jgi:hypothetical protein
MARIRTVKPEFFTSEQVADCSPTARLLFIGMWCFCDDGGVHPASLKRLKMEIFPGDNISEIEIGEFIKELLKAKLLEEYQAFDGKTYWAVTGWSHQKIEKPTFRHPQNSTTIRRPLDDSSAPEGKGREGRVVEKKEREEQSIFSNKNLLRERDALARTRSLISDDWKLPEDWGEWAANEADISPERVITEARKFHNNAKSKAIKSADWLAEWKKWIYRTKEFKK